MARIDEFHECFLGEFAPSAHSHIRKIRDERFSGELIMKKDISVTNEGAT